MYRISVKKYGYEERKLLVESYEELRAIITLAPDSEYEVVSVEKYNYELAKDFLEEITKDSKPEGLVYGVDCYEDCKNCKLTKNNKKGGKK